MVGAVGDMASVKQCKFWKMGEDGLCCSSSAIQTRPGPSSLLEERSKTPLFLMFSLCYRLPPKWGKRPRYEEYGITLVTALMNWLPVFHLQWLSHIPHDRHHLPTQLLCGTLQCKNYRIFSCKGRNFKTSFGGPNSGFTHYMRHTFGMMKIFIFSNSVVLLVVVRNLEFCTLFINRIVIWKD